MMLSANSTQELAESLHNRFDISRQEASVFQYCTLSEFTKAQREKKQKQLEELEERLDWYKD